MTTTQLELELIKDLDFPVLKEANEWRHACTWRNQNARPTWAARKEKLLCWPQKDGYFFFITVSEKKEGGVSTQM